MVAMVMHTYTLKMVALVTINSDSFFGFRVQIGKDTCRLGLGTWDSKPFFSGSN